MSRPLQIFVFVTVALLLVGGLHAYFWMRLVRDTALPAPWSTLATVAIVLLALSLPATVILARGLQRPVALLAWLAFSWLGLLFLLFVTLLISDVVSAGFSLHALIGGAAPDAERRQLLARIFAGTATTFAAGTAVAAAFAALRPVQVKDVSVTLSRLPKALDGFSIVAISDVHLGPTIGADFMRSVVERINALSPDLVAIVGDLVDGSVDELRESAAPLAGLRAREGVFFVTGNHEYYSGAEAWMKHLGTLGIRALQNERVSVRRDGATFELAGTHDLQGRSFGMGHDLDRALSGRDPTLPLVLLSHQPKTFPESAQKGVDLQISGHTHGGQIWPFGFLVRLQQGFLAGLSRVGEAQLYVSRGTGYWGPPMRLGAPAEISRIVLRTP